MPKVIYSLQFHISHQLRYSGIGAIWGNWVRIPQIMCKDTGKVIQSLQLLVSHQMRPYSSVRALCGSSYTGFTGTWVLGQFGEIRPEYPKSCAGTHEKNSKVFSSLFHIKWELTLVSGPSVGWTIPVSQVLGYCGNLGKLGPNTPTHLQGQMKSIQVFRSLFHIKWDLTLVSEPSAGSAIPVSRVLGQFGKIGLEYPKSRAETHEK